MKKACGFPQTCFNESRHPEVTTPNSFVNRNIATFSPRTFNIADVMYRLGAAHETFVQAMTVAR
jgi:hypothetical protein